MTTMTPRSTAPRVPTDPRTTHRAITVVAQECPKIEHIVTWIGMLLGTQLRITSRATTNQPLIEYSHTNRIPGAYWIPRSDYTAANPPPLLPEALPPSSENQLGFDLFDAIRFWLTDAAHANAPDDAFDRHDRLIAERSIFSCHQRPPLPIVNHYVDAFRRAIERRFQLDTLPLWPGGRKACIVLTHDVDAPLDPHSPTTRRHLNRLHGASFVSRFRSAVRDVVFHRDRKRAEVDRHWLFEEIMAEEARNGFRSTFFFASRHCGMIGASAAHDVRYDIAARPFRRLFGNLADRGFETALHASYNIHQSPDMLAGERRRLERLAGHPVIGVRHHYWRLGRPIWPTLIAHDAARLRYDASLAFNEAPGFRFGVALPFRPLPPRAHAPIDTLQIPTMLMDGAIFYRPGSSVADALQIANDWIDRLVDAGGCGAIDWHVRTSYPASREFADWGRAYLGLLATLAERSDVFVTNCAGLLDHLDRRRAGPADAERNMTHAP